MEYFGRWYPAPVAALDSLNRRSGDKEHFIWLIVSVSDVRKLSDVSAVDDDGERGFYRQALEISLPLQ